ncbi:MAG: hypothetical protein ACLFXM_12845, partial [Acidimicrobiia bacterium]
LGRLVSSVGEARETVGLARAPRFLAQILALPPWWGRPSLPEAGERLEVLPSLLVSSVSLVVVAGALVVAVAGTHRRGDGPGRMAALTGLVALCVALVAAATMPVGIFGVAAHHVLWMWPLAVFVTFALVLALVGWRRGEGEQPDRTRGPTAPARAGLVAVAAAAVLLGALNLPTMNAGSGPSADAEAIPVVEELLPQLDVLREESGVLLEVRDLRPFEPYSGPVMAELRRLGVPWYVNAGGMVRQVGDPREYEGGASVRLLLREGRGARDVPPGMRRIAFVDGLSDEEAAELAALEEQLAPFIARGGLVVRTDGAADGGDDVDVPSSRLRDPTYMLGTGTLRSLVDRDLLVVREPWATRLSRYSDLHYKATFLTVAVLAQPLEER